MRIVGLKNGKVIKEINKNDKKLYTDGTLVTDDVDVMLEIPKCYLKFEEDTNYYYIKLSSKAESGFDCLSHKVNGKVKDYIYVGCYLGFKQTDDTLRSVSNVMPTNLLDIYNARMLCTQKGNGYTLEPWYVLILRQFLFTLAFKNLNSQQCFARGIINTSMNTTGRSDKQGFVNSSSICFCGIEDYYGNLRELIDGIFYYAGHVYINQQNTAFSELGRYNNINSEEITTTGFIQKIFCTKELGFLLSQNSAGNSSSYFCDHIYYKDKRNRLWAGYGGSFYESNIDNGGVYSLDFSYTDTGRSSSVGARLCYI